MKVDANPDYLGKTDEEILNAIPLPPNAVFLPQHEVEEYKQKQLIEIRERQNAYLEKDNVSTFGNIQPGSFSEEEQL